MPAMTAGMRVIPTTPHHRRQAAESCPSCAPALCPRGIVTPATCDRSLDLWVSDTAVVTAVSVRVASPAVASSRCRTAPRPTAPETPATARPWLAVFARSMQHGCGNYTGSHASREGVVVPTIPGATILVASVAWTGTDHCSECAGPSLRPALPRARPTGGSESESAGWIVQLSVSAS